MGKQASGWQNLSVNRRTQGKVVDGEVGITSVTVVNWNVEWATPRSWSRRDEILRRIEREAPDIVCLTETDIRLLAGTGATSSTLSPTA